MILTPKVRKTLDIVTRSIIATLSLSYIVYRLYILPAGQVDAFINSVLGNKNLIYHTIGLFLLMIMNWGLESKKWQWLIGRSEKITFGKAYEAVLGGLASSVFTPNRVGEFMGRVFILKKTDPFKAILLTIVGSYSQLLVTMIFGTIAYILFAPHYLTSLLFDSTWIVQGVSVTFITISFVMLIMYFNINVLHRISIILPEKYSTRIRNSIDAMADSPIPLLFETLLLSALRYGVFTVQFYIAINMMGPNFSFGQCMLVIPIIYLVLAAIPTVALTELGVRGSVSVFLFGMLVGGSGLNDVTTLAVVSASSLIWFINIAVPSLAGLVVVFRLKFFRR